MSLWMDVTTAAACAPPATGIPRVELKLAEYLCEASDVRLCVYDAQAGRFCELARDQFARVSESHRASSAGPGLRLEIQRSDVRASGGVDIFGRGDVLVSCGFNWRPELGNMARVYLLQKLIGLQLIAMCYDLIPIRFPEFIPGMEEIFVPYMTGMVRHANHVLCISRCTQGDLLRWAESRGERQPQTSIVPLGCEVKAPGATFSVDRLRQILERRFLLCVSTIEHRKNQQVLCRAYTRLVESGVRDMPLLVLVGAIGEGCAEVLEAIETYRHLRDNVVVLSGVSDAELAALYRACLFTLYPSLYEGWGLPVSESLAYGKFCVASDRGALPEAGQSFVDYIDPCNTDDWAGTIARYSASPDAVATREVQIRQHYRPRSWTESAQHVLDIARRLRRSP